MEEAVLKRLPVTITNKSEDNKWQVYKSNFLSVNGNRIVLGQPMSDSADCQFEPASGQEIAISFKKGYNKCLFNTRIIAAQSFELEPGLHMPAISAYRPEQIEKIQRRAYNRTCPPPGENITVTFWRIDNKQQKFQAVLVNMSAGGLGLHIEESLLDKLDKDGQYEIQFVPFTSNMTDRSIQGMTGNTQEPLCLQGRLRQAEELPEGHETNQSGSMALLGFQLVGLEMSEEGRNTLRRIGRITNIYERQKDLAYHPDLRLSD